MELKRRFIKIRSMEKKQSKVNGRTVEWIPFKQNEQDQSNSIQFNRLSRRDMEWEWEWNGMETLYVQMEYVFPNTKLVSHRLSNGRFFRFPWKRDRHSPNVA
ncbi:hypothetical protein SOMG_00412 [Schizosaccharomyces osmophilus]|uniref:Uncharacterized protein n=1 Tax=Schizosaccharomyces osmophilus TaxID=2545709 RepID=A0AAE9W7A9_9SCHI|nr:uncharacterized protein SOMG_00412 [Schizosaccharomyces osmophilus]WBW71220.1 hypothetical protein SOMG_00412 [Schizosaccharomyces osmophilus]